MSTPSRWSPCGADRPAATANTARPGRAWRAGPGPPTYRHTCSSGEPRAARPDRPSRRRTRAQGSRLPEQPVSAGLARPGPGGPGPYAVGLRNGPDPVPATPPWRPGGPAAGSLSTSAGRPDSPAAGGGGAPAAAGSGGGGGGAGRRRWASRRETASTLTELPTSLYLPAQPA